MDHLLQQLLTERHVQRTTETAVVRAWVIEPEAGQDATQYYTWPKLLFIITLCAIIVAAIALYYTKLVASGATEQMNTVLGPARPMQYQVCHDNSNEHNNLMQ